MPCTKSWSRTTLRCSQPRRCSSKPRSGTASPGQDHGGTPGTAAPVEEILCARHSRDQGPVTRSRIACRSLSVDEAVARGESPLLPAPWCRRRRTCRSGSAGWRRLQPAAIAGRSQSIRRRPGGCSAEYRSELVALCSSPASQDLTAHEDGRDQQDPTAAASVHRARSKRPPRARPDQPPRPHPPSLQAAARAVSATAPNQVWMWDMTHARGRIYGLFCCPCLFTDLHGRTKAGRGRQREESAEHAAPPSAPSAWTTAASARSLC